MRIIISITLLTISTISIFFYFSSHKKEKNPLHITLATYAPLYGNKTANLLALQNALDKTPLKTNVSIPPFIGLSHDEVSQFLCNGKLDLTKRWNKLIDTLTKKEQDEIVQEKKLSKKFIKILHTLHKQLESQRYSFLEIQLPKKIIHYLEEAHNNNWQLMVRSSSKEDGANCANAGGNESIAAVQPTESAIINAMLDVIISYISEKSLQQRLLNNDPNIFQAPFVPILIQKMIGESITTESTDIPVSCVVYTEEPYGNTHKTMLIQATYGHAEAIVQSLVPVDNYYLINNTPHSLITEKPTRIISDQGKIIYVKNPTTITSKPALTHSTITAIAECSSTLEQWYEYPLDIELIFEPASNTIYIVQARPIVKNLQTKKPNYLATTTQFSDDILFKSNTITHGNNTVQLLSKQQIILTKTLDEGLNKYLHTNESKKNIVAIVTQQDALATSHAAAVLRSDNKIIMTCKELEALEKKIETHHFLILDPQRELIIAQKNNKQPFIQYGLLNHPLPALISIPTDLPINSASKNKLPVNHYPKSTLTTLVEYLKESNSQVAMQAYDSILYQIHTFLLETKNKIAQKDELTALLEMTTQQLENLYAYASSLKPTIKIASSFASRSLERLAPIRLVEALLWQKNNSSIINGYSFEHLKNNLNETCIFIKNCIKNSASPLTFPLDIKLLTLAKTGAERTLSKSQRNKWINFIEAISLYGNDEQRNKFLQLLQIINQKKMLTEYINTSFAMLSENFDKISKNNLDEYIEEILHEYEQTKPILSYCQKLTQAMNEISHAPWNNQYLFEKNIIKLTTTLLPIIESSLQKSLYFYEKKSNILAKVSLLKTLHIVIEQFDLIIKQIKSNPKYKNIAQKNKHFHTLLTHYASLLPILNSNQEVYLSITKKLNQYDPLSEQELINSKNFNALLLIQQTTEAKTFRPEDFDNYVQTLEDAFTSIHQLLLHQLGKFLVKWGLNSIIPTPFSVTQVTNNLNLTDRLTSIALDENSIHYTFNQQLRVHSLSATLSYHIPTESLTTMIQFYGEDEYLRWQIIHSFVVAISHAMHLTLINCEHNSYAMKISWQIKDLTLNENLLQLINLITETSFTLGIENRKYLYDCFEKLFKQAWTLFSAQYTSSKLAIDQLNKIITNSKKFNFFIIPALEYLANQNSLKNTWIELIINYIERHYDSETTNNDTSMLLFFMLQKIIHTLKFDGYTITPWPSKYFKNETEMHTELPRFIKEIHAYLKNKK